MGLHRCTEQECPYLGQESGRGCGCHKTDEQVLQGRVAVLVEALEPFANLGVGPGPDDEVDAAPYRILRGAIRNARSALEETA